MPTNLYGPDGRYLAELLVAKGYEVDGVRHFVELAFAQVNRRMAWQGERVDEVGLEELVEEMVAADLAAMTANATTLPAVVHG